MQGPTANPKSIQNRSRTPEKSTGHICFLEGYEYFAGSNYVFKSAGYNPIECTGRRECAEIVMSVKDWNGSYLGGIYPVYQDGWKEVD